MLNGEKLDNLTRTANKERKTRTNLIWFNVRCAGWSVVQALAVAAVQPPVERRLRAERAQRRESALMLQANSRTTDLSATPGSVASGMGTRGTGRQEQACGFATGAGPGLQRAVP